jgi:hypothetical protein
VTLAAIVLVSASALFSTGMPALRAETPGAQIQTVWHTVAIDVGPKEVVYEAATLYRNLGKSAVSATVQVPLLAHLGEPAEVPIQANWAGSAVSAKPGWARSGESAGTVARWKAFPVSFKPGEWRSFKTRVALPLQQGGLGERERQVVYGLLEQDRPLEQFKAAIRYPRDLVFQVVSAEPKTWGWKIGPTGAFADLKQTTLPGGGAVVFRFYSGEFDG